MSDVNCGRFVIQEHTRRGDVHWDMMLASAGRLLTWRLGRAPEDIAAGRCGAVKISDHPLRFLTYEGPVQAGAGTVRIVERGRWRRVQPDDETDDRMEIPRSDDRTGLSRSDDSIEMLLDGTALNGGFALVHGEGNQWEFIAR